MSSRLRSGRLLVVVVAIGVVVGLAVAAGVFNDFSSFEFWDDEGYLMLSVRHALDGKRLYADVRVPYGPAYYFEQWIVHGALGVPLTHATVRMTSEALRFASAGLAGIAAARIAASVPLGALTFFLVHQNLAQLSEPGHPQELGTLLLLALPACATFASRRPAAVAAALGLLAVTVLLVKVNLGAFATLAVAAALGATLEAGALRLVVRTVGVVGALALPTVLVGFPASWLPFVVAATLWVVGVAPWAFQPARDGGSRRLLLVAVAGGAVALAAIVAFAFASGASLRTMFDQLIVAPRAIYAVPLPFGMPAEPSMIITGIGAAASIVAAVVVARRGVRGPERWLLGVGSFALGAFTLTKAWIGVSTGAGTNLPFAVGPWMWIVVAAGVDRPWTERLSRHLLAWLAVLAPLQIYPIPGSQMICGALPGVVCGAVAFGDGLLLLATPLRESRRAVAIATAGALMLAVAIAGGYRQLDVARKAYAEATPLELPGTGALRLPYPNVLMLTHLSKAIRNECDVLLTVPGFQSLHFWTGVGPPTNDQIAHGSQYLDDVSIARMAEAMRAASRPCVVHRPDVWETPPDRRIATEIMPLVPYQEVYGWYLLFRGGTM